MIRTAILRRAPLLLAGLLALSGCEGASLPLAPDAAGPARQANPPQQVNLTFDKSLLSGGVWTGTVAGDVTGTLRTELYDLRVAGRIWHVGFLWIIDPDGPAGLIVADLSGTLNTATGAVVMNGTVVTDASGMGLLGARVHEEGQLVDPSTLRFTGKITILEPTAR